MHKELSFVLCDAVFRRMSQKVRITVSLPPDVHQELSKRAEREGRSTSNLAAFLLTHAIRDKEPSSPMNNQNSDRLEKDG
ncbi:ribbon-helix-helix domain-containing protein [Gloeocapsopsis dulcis]|uniref:CopG-like ribbon-helix-helix domain-containing protein n=2 Tax=Gloeocapsopsis TaxID=693222 RepID=A0A6N8FUA8_9CHRO|nr:hypothetical protein [Gloeocapsopsis dulcis AAB1 = 1H9]